MTLKSIELIGFKSFGKKSLVSFTTPITAVVGPNGSGKSNIVESIRFVLGEQSMKSLRGKGGVDLIFKGSKGLSSSNRAIVTITFDNTNKVFAFTNSGLGVSLDYDEISISREVFADGANRYSINNTEVRLKDVVDLLASVNIGSSGHHIISQGEADRVLNASNKDRRGMIEDALGLKVYQYRIKESERKLEKTLINIKEVQAIRREIAPHMAFLKKQVQAIEKAKVMREELAGLYKTYFSLESTYVHNETKRLTHERRILDEEGLAIGERIIKLKESQKISSDTTVVENENNLKIKELEIQLVQLRKTKDEHIHTRGRLEGVLEGIDRELSRASRTQERVIPEAEWKELIAHIESDINQALEASELGDVISILESMKERLQKLYTDSVPEPTTIHEELRTQSNELREKITTTTQAIDEGNEKERNILNEIGSMRALEKEVEVTLRDSERMLYELMREENEVTSRLHSIHFEEEKLATIKNAFEMELTEGGALIGREVIDYARMHVEEEVVRSSQEDLRRRIERIKIKLEDSGSGNGADVLKEYEDTEERDSFLSKEIEDLNQSIDSLRSLIGELRENLDTEFKVGIEKINKQFQEFFALMFGGGSAFLSVVMEQKRSRQDTALLLEDGKEKEGEENDIGFERGIEINVTLPQKKVKDLHMLSGGERSLASIALLFAISQVNPPPFLVLDETDAALDEANSRKYGNMLENLSRYSQLVVVTHNRETMSRAQVLYGVTMDISGASKLLSIRLEDASSYAK